MIRKARLGDAQRIYELINQYAQEGMLLPRSLNSIYEHIRDFWVYEEEGEIIGCVALQIVWKDLAELRSLAVDFNRRGEGIGAKLINASLKEARELGIDRVFSLTYASNFFEKLGFKIVDKSVLPHKVWSDCINCVKFTNCDEVAVILEFDESSPAELEGCIQTDRG